MADTFHNCCRNECHYVVPQEKAGTISTEGGFSLIGGVELVGDLSTDQPELMGRSRDIVIRQNFSVLRLWAALATAPYSLGGSMPL